MRHPTRRPPTISTTNCTAELRRSAPQRPSGTATLLIGIDRNRSVMPRLVSCAIAVIVDSTPNSMESANMPGRRYSR